MLKGVVCILFFALWVFPFSYAVSKEAGNESVSRQVLVYDVYASGFHVVQARLKMDLAQDYDVSLEANTLGFLQKLVPWEGIFRSGGSITEAVYKPEEHVSKTVWRDELETSTYVYNDKSDLVKLTVEETGKKPDVKKLVPSLTDNTTDVLSAALVALEAVSERENCSSASDIFDGKRRFELRFNDEGTDVLQRTKYNLYEGKAIRCIVEVVPKGGEWHKKPRGWMSIQEQGRERGTMPTVWMAQMDADSDGEDRGKIAVPVKVMVKTAYGTLFMHLTDYTYEKNGYKERMTLD